MESQVGLSLDSDPKTLSFLTCEMGGGRFLDRLPASIPWIGM